MKNFAIVGGDMRQIYLAQSLKSDGYNVSLCGFDKKILSENNLSHHTFNEACSSSNIIILPLPTTKDKLIINTPLLTETSEKIKIDNDFFNLLKNKKVFCGQFKNFKDSDQRWKSLDIYDYYESENFAVLNSIPTAEAALAIGILESKIILKKSNCLVAGFGRVGHAMASILKNIGANVTILSRSENKAANIKSLGYDYMNLKKTSNMTKFDIIYNTIPCIIFNNTLLKNCSKSVLIIDLASKPGGVDFKSAEKLGIKTIHALALPGKYSPKSAGEITKKIILDMLQPCNT